LNPPRRAKGVQNSREKSYNGSKKIHHTTGAGGPWEGLNTVTSLPSIHSLTQSMANKLHLMKKNEKKTHNSSVGLQPSPPIL
jgi:hypothetical protein